MNKLGVLVIHGMGEQDSMFADGLITEVSQRLGTVANDVCWESAWWAPVLENAESTILGRLSEGNQLDFMKLRHFVFHALGDAVAYQRVPGGTARTNVYEQIHRVVAVALNRLRTATRAGAPVGAKEVPLVVIAHSLGGHIMSNHIWDLQKQVGPTRAIDPNPFETAQTLAGIVTIGCNIPLFALAYNKMEPIAFPASDIKDCFPDGTAPEKLAAAAKWLNLYDPDDVLGYPLKPLSYRYGQIVSEDRAVNVGGMVTSWNPASHGEYWSDNEVTKPIAELLGGLLKLLSGPMPG